MLWLLLLFVGVPALELAVLIAIGREVGLLATLGLLLASGFVGSWLARREGTRALRAYQTALAEGRAPEEGVLGGLLVFAGCCLLVAPGVITDVVGLGLLFRPTRRMAAGLVRRWLARRMASGQLHVMTLGGDAPRPQHGARTPDFIDVDPGD